MHNTLVWIVVCGVLAAAGIAVTLAAAGDECVTQTLDAVTYSRACL